MVFCILEVPKIITVFQAFQRFFTEEGTEDVLSAFDAVCEGKLMLLYVAEIIQLTIQKVLFCKETLRQVFIRVYRLEIHSVMLVFATQLCDLLHL